MAGETQPRDVLDYWKSIGPEGWFRKDEAIDREIVEKFGEIHARAAAGALTDWRAKPDSALALIIVLDQFSRNMFRGDARTFAQDALALDLACEALANGFDERVPAELSTFFYMPFMHSESILDQERCVALFHAHGGGESLKYAIIHHDVIARFGRFPHRNSVLGRHTTPAEAAFLEAGGFGG
jgi:uncharacterized protein (DUF924 family)